MHAPPLPTTLQLKNRHQEMQISLIGQKAAAVSDEVAEWESKFQELKLVVGSTNDKDVKFDADCVIRK